MDAKSKIGMKKSGVLTVEKHTMELELYGDDERQFLNDPAKFLRSYFEAQGEYVRQITVNVRRQQGSGQSVSGGAPDDDMYAIVARYHVVWPADEASYMWVEVTIVD